MKIIRRKRITIRHTEATVEYTTASSGGSQRCPHCLEPLSTGTVEELNAHSATLIGDEIVNCSTTQLIKRKEQI